MQTEDTSEHDQALQALLKDFPAPEASPAFIDQSLARATYEGARRQRNRWIMTGFGSAVAAGVALWIVGGFFMTTPELPVVTPGIPGVTMTLEQPRTINLVFASTTALKSAVLTVTLPDGLELAGFPGQREISWHTSLNEGKNLLPLELIAVSRVGGEVLAKLEHDDRERVFRLRVEVS